MIHVCFGLHDGNGRYSKFAGTTMASIFENTLAPVTIHILHDATLTDDNRDKFSYLAGRHNQRVNFHNVEKLCGDEIKFLREKLADKIKLRFSIGAFYRLLMKKILAPHAVGKSIYLDADIIVNLDIDELWRQDLKNFPLAAVPELQATLNNMVVNKFLLHSGRVKREDYFCSGVMVFNLDALSDNFFHDGVQFLVDNPACESPDQDILNAFFSKNYLKLEQKFDSFVLSDKRQKLPVAKKIYHYAGRCVELKPNDPYNKLFMKYFAQTPWLNGDTLFQIGDGFRRSNDEFAMKIQWLMRLSMEHRRAFFVAPNNLQTLKVLFCISADEQIIEFRDNNSINELVAKMRESNGRTVFFICHDKYDDFRHFLMGLGFREFAHFVNGLTFMTRNQCGYTHPEWNLVSNM